MGNWYHVEVTSSLPVRRRLAELSGSSPSSSTAKSSSLSEVRDFSSRTARVPKNCFPLTGLRCRLLTRASCSFALECRYGEAISASRHSRERGCFRALDAFGAAGGGGGPGIAIDDLGMPGQDLRYGAGGSRIVYETFDTAGCEQVAHFCVANTAPQACSCLISLSFSLSLSLHFRFSYSCCTFVSIRFGAGRARAHITLRPADRDAQCCALEHAN